MRFWTPAGSAFSKCLVLPAGGVLLLGGTGCFAGDLFSTTVEKRTCPAVGWTTLVAEVRDQAGRPAAQGAKLVIAEGDYRAESRVPPHFPNPLRLYPESDSRPGRYRVVVTRPHYEPGSIARVSVPSGCRYGKPTVVARVTLRLRPDAPPIRSLMVYSSTSFLHNIQGPLQLEYQLDADPGIDGSVLWKTSNPQAVTVTSGGKVAPGCGTGPRFAWITATSVAAPAVYDSVRVGVSASAAGQCHEPAGGPRG